MSSYGCIRKTLCFVNLLFWILGCGLFGVGLWLRLVNVTYATTLLPYQALSGDSLIITAGVVAVVLGFLGCCGSWFQNKYLLRTYFTLVIIVLLLELTAGTLGFIYRRHIGEILQDELLAGLRNRYTVENKHGLKEMWDTMQLKFECCGIRSYEDWFEISAWPGKKWVPSTCCLPQYSNSTSCGHALETFRWQQMGCYPKLHTWLMEKMYIVGIVSLTFAFIQLFGIISALIVVCSLNRKRQRSYFQPIGSMYD